MLPLPHHLGLGGCVQAGYKLAFELGYQYVIRVDGDGQHDARDIPRMFEALRTSGCEMVIGSRFVNGKGAHSGAVRGLGIRFFRWCCGRSWAQRVHDPTSGFVGVNRSALQVFSKSFPLEYPEIEALVVLQRKRFRFVEVPLPDAAAHHRALVDHGAAIDLLHRTRTAGSIRQRAQIRPAGAAPGRAFIQPGKS